MTIEQTIATFERKIELQNMMINNSVNDAFTMKCVKTISAYEVRINELKSL